MLTIGYPLKKKLSISKNPKKANSNLMETLLIFFSFEMETIIISPASNRMSAHLIVPIVSYPGASPELIIVLIAINTSAFVPPTAILFLTIRNNITNTVDTRSIVEFSKLVQNKINTPNDSVLTDIANLPALFFFIS